MHVIPKGGLSGETYEKRTQHGAEEGSKEGHGFS